MEEEGGTFGTFQCSKCPRNAPPRMRPTEEDSENSEKQFKVLINCSVSPGQHLAPYISWQDPGFPWQLGTWQLPGSCQPICEFTGIHSCQRNCYFLHRKVNILVGRLIHRNSQDLVSSLPRIVGTDTDDGRVPSIHWWRQVFLGGPGDTASLFTYHFLFT